jgi:hypothetical protein
MNLFTVVVRRLRCWFGGGNHITACVSQCLLAIAYCLVHVLRKDTHLPCPPCILARNKMLCSLCQVRIPLQLVTHFSLKYFYFHQFILFIVNIVISRYISVLDTFILMTSNMSRNDYWASLTSLVVAGGLAGCGFKWCSCR